MHICPYRAMAIFILNKISLLEPKAPNRVRSAINIFPSRSSLMVKIWRRWYRLFHLGAS